MKSSPFRTAVLMVFVAGVSLVSLARLLADDKPPLTGAETEKRFPPLVVPPGFKATLFACDPLIEYPSVMALGPRPGTIFLAHDYMTGLGAEIVRRDEIRLVADTDGDGYADTTTVYAGGFNSIQGLTYHDGTVFAMHSPLLTALRDTDGDGIADERRDLLAGLGLPPEENPPRLHCANGVVAGHDGWLYLALGDHGCNVLRPEGDRLIYEGGGILRCRTDGRDLHVLATGLRNIYDVALDDQLNVFVRDNENDGGTYKIRVCHSFFGAHHGYPYLYENRPEEAMPPMADLGLGSSAGGVCYLEHAMPPEYVGNLIFCEWGRSVVRYERRRAGGGFATTKEHDFAAGAATDPYGLKPTDLVVARDGSILFSDWADGQRPRRGRGRVYRITYVGDGAPGKTTAAGGGPEPKSVADWTLQLDSPSYYKRLAAQLAIERAGRTAMQALLTSIQSGQVGERGRLHVVWVLARVGGRDAIDDLFQIAQSDPDPRVSAQAVRALADLTDPVLVHHRLDTGRGDAKVAVRLAELAKRDDPRILLEVIVALGRLRWSESPRWLRETLTEQPDPAVAHAAMQALRRAGNWPAVVKLLDGPGASPMRSLATRAIGDVADAAIVDALIERLPNETDADQRRRYADVLARVYKKPGPWVYWGYRPGPRPAGTVTWPRTDAIERTLDRLLADTDVDLRTATLRHMQREQIPVRLETLSRWLHEERGAERVAAILDSLQSRPAAEVRELLASVIGDRRRAADNRLAAVRMFSDGLDGPTKSRLLELAAAVEDGPVLAELVRQVAAQSDLAATPLLLDKLNSPAAEVRSVAIGALADRGVKQAAARVTGLLKDEDIRVRRAAASAAGRLAVRDAIEPLLASADDADVGLRLASLDALRRLGEPRGLPLAVAAIDRPETQLAGLEFLRDVGGPDHLEAVAEVARRNRSIDLLTAVMRVLTKWQSSRSITSAEHDRLERTAAEVQALSGVLLRWNATRVASRDEVPGIVERVGPAGAPSPTAKDAAGGWRTIFADGTQSRVQLDSVKSPDGGASWLALTDVALAEPTRAHFLGSSNGLLQVWLNGRLVHRGEKPSGFQADAERFEVALDKGVNRLLVQVASASGPPLFHLRFRRQSATAEHERLVQLALRETGSVNRGRELFQNAEKSQCLKCHRMGDRGERVGPELTGVGSRFSRIHLIESILEPSRTIAPSYETLAVALNSGRILAGVKIAETDSTLTLVDNQSQKHVLQKSDIDEMRPQRTSTMPDDLVKRFRDKEFLDLLAYLIAQKKPQ